MKAARCLALAASPSFALMALGNLARGTDPAAILCSATGMAPFGGMTAMYGLMSVFHASPWLRLISARYMILRLTYRNQN
ncbi:MAG: hypothetical protein V4610_15535 [Pseudomonadota bacterium]